MPDTGIWSRMEQHAASHSALPFWSWNDKLDPAELSEQIEKMHGASLGGFFMHARGGLITEYMESDWMRAVEECADKAERLQMEAWLYDENGWPSGFADGAVPQKGEAFQQKGLRAERIAEDGARPAGTLGVYALSDGCVRRTANPKKGDLAVILVVNAYYIDALNRDAVRAFLELTHERYIARLGAEAFQRLKGFFTDEPQYANGLIPWSPKLEEALRKEYGICAADRLGALFLEGADSRRFRSLYYKTAARLFREGFLGQMSEWCAEHGLSLTGHVMAEDSLVSQLRSTGGAMACYRYFDMPGIDWLGRMIASPVVPKQLGSVCAQLGKPQALSESFALCGWDVSFNELKWIMQWQYVNGVNRMCPHLSAYSLRGCRKRDYPPSLHIQSPWFERYHAFNDYSARLGSLLSCGEDLTDVLLLSPLTSVYGSYTPLDMGDAQAFSAAFEQASELLSGMQLLHHYGDETILADDAKVQDARLSVGRCTYRAVIIPDCETLTRPVAEILTRFAESGGKLYALGKTPSMIDYEPSPEVVRLFRAAKPFPSKEEFLKEVGPAACVSVFRAGAGEERVHFAARKLPGGRRLYFITSLSPEPLGECEIRIRGSGSYAIIDPERRTQAGAPNTSRDGWTAIKLRFAAAQSYLLLEDAASSPPAAQRTEHLRFGEDWEIVSADPNALTLEFCRYRIDGGPIQGPKPVILLQNELLARREPCEVTMLFDFHIRPGAEIGNLELVTESPENFTFKLNGTPFDFADQGWYRDKSFRRADIRRFVRDGDNRLELATRFYQNEKVYHVLFGDNIHESERNKLTYDTELENCYLIGDFSTGSSAPAIHGTRRTIRTAGPFMLDTPRERVHIQNITAGGFWFFSGKMRLRQTVALAKEPGTRYQIAFPKLNAPVAVIFVNGKEAGTLAFAPFELDVTEYLAQGPNEVEIVLYSGNRNLLGPHHRSNGESYQVAPATFTDQPDWEDLPPPYWTDEYYMVEFGIPLT